MKPENKEKLRQILTYHVVAGRVGSSEVTKMTSAKAVSGGSVRIAVKGSDVMVNDARVVTPDVAASNGVIHVIDSVLMPPAK